MNALDIVQAIQARHPLGKGWVCMREVTPPKTTRRFDALALSVFQSHRTQVHGFEVKVSRSDWLAELNNPAKSGELQRWCTHYWLVCPRGVAEPEEVPPGWGMMAAAETDGACSLRQVKRPTVAAINPSTWDIAWWRCMLLRLADRQRATPAEIAKAEAQAFARGRDSAEACGASEVAGLRADNKRMHDIIDQARSATGVDLHAWTSWPDLGRAMQIVQKCRMSHLATEAERAAGRFSEIAERLHDCAQNIREGARA